MKSIEEQVEIYKAKLLAKQAEKEASMSSLYEAAKAFCAEYESLDNGATKTTLKPVYGRLQAFINGVPYFTRNRAKGDE